MVKNNEVDIGSCGNNKRIANLLNAKKFLKLGKNSFIKFTQALKLANFA